MKKGKDKKSVQSNVSGKIMTMTAMVAALGLSLGIDVGKTYAGDETMGKIQTHSQAEKAEGRSPEILRDKAQSDQIKWENTVESQQYKVESQQNKIQSQQIKVENIQDRSNIK